MISTILDYVVFIIVAINTILSIGVFLRNPKSKDNRIYFILITLLDLWILSNFLENEPDLVGMKAVELFLRLDFVFALFLVYAWYWFCVTLVGVKSKFHKVFGLVTLVLSAFLSFNSIFGSTLIKDIIFYDDVIHFKNGIFWPLYGTLLLVMMVSGLCVLIRHRRMVSALKKKQVDLVIWGFTLSLGIGIIVNFIQVYYPISSELSRIGLYGMTFMVVFTGYAITREKLFEIKVLIARAISFMVFLGIIAGIYALFLLVIIEKIFSISIASELWALSFIVIVGAIFTFHPLQVLIKNLTNKIFFKGEYNLDKLLSKLTRIMAEIIDLELLIDKVLGLLTSEMKISKGAFAIVDNHRVSLVMGAEIYEKSLKDNIQIEELFHKYFSSNPYFNFDELEENPLKNLFRENDIIFAMPLKVQEEEVAILILGSKSSGEFYSSKDISLLSLFGAEAGIAIQNAKAYQRIKKFSKELEKKVQERTAELEETQGRELEKARQVAKLKDEFVFIAAHELRTPVTAIRGFLELVSEAMGSFPKDIKHHLTSINEASEHLSQLINDLLQISRSDAGTITITTTTVEIEPILEKILKEITVIADKKKVSVKFKTKISGVKALADAKKLEEVLMNLLSNAVKYNREGGSVDIAVYGLDGQVMIEIKDTGYGIPKDQRNKIFQKFFRAGAKGTEDILGTGLGLFISKMLVEKMGGQIQFSSVEGEGSTFGVILPRL